MKLWHSGVKDKCQGARDHTQSTHTDTGLIKTTQTTKIHKNTGNMVLLTPHNALNSHLPSASQCPLFLFHCFLSSFPHHTASFLRSVKCWQKECERKDISCACFSWHTGFPYSQHFAPDQAFSNTFS